MGQTELLRSTRELLRPTHDRLRTAQGHLRPTEGPLSPKQGPLGPTQGPLRLTKCLLKPNKAPHSNAPLSPTNDTLIARDAESESRPELESVGVDRFTGVRVGAGVSKI